MSRNRLLALVGPTAVGKSSWAERLAKALGAAILSVDSMQVYRGLDVGTAKPSKAIREAIRYGGLDCVDVHEPFDAASFVNIAEHFIKASWKQGQPVILCGGTGLYLRALRYGLTPAPGRDIEFRKRLKERREREGIEAIYRELMDLDPIQAQKIHPLDWVRIERALEVYHVTGKTMHEWQRAHGFQTPKYNIKIWGLTREREEVYRRIEFRLKEMWKDGLIEEAKLLLDLPDESPPTRALGYRQALSMLRGECGSKEALNRAMTQTRRFAKRQWTWFKKVRGLEWISLDGSARALETKLLEMAKLWLEES